MHVVKTSAKGQVVIPAEIRDRIGLQPGDRVLVQLVGEKVVIEAVPEDPVGAVHGLLRGEPSLTGVLEEERRAEDAREDERAGLVRPAGVSRG